MKLVLCIDRDDDFGYKADIKSPIIGRKNNVQAALKLGLTDPEDSDTNTLLAGIKAFDTLKAKNYDVQIATICGDQNIGVISDNILSDQIDNVLGRFNPDSVVIVTDGAEDEYVRPMIQSRVKISSVIRVTVRQAPTLESYYYIVKRLFEDKDMWKKFGTPIMLMCLLFSLSIFSGNGDYALAIICLALGFYILVKKYDLEDQLRKASNDFVLAAEQGKLIVPFAIMGGLLIFLGVMLGFVELQRKGIDIFSGDQKELVRGLSLFFEPLKWFLFSGIFVCILGLILDIFRETGEVPKKRVLVWIVGLLSSILMIEGILNILSNIDKPDEPLVNLFGNLALSVVLLVFVYFVNKYLKNQERQRERKNLTWQY